ncbi:MAG: ABC transporter ATP-binding protein [Tissierella sp.]|nr:ABC transporter ATP-binding protein [Tissierella sp.]
MSNGHLLETKKLSINFGGIKAVDQVDFHINKGEIIGLIGPNGAGKTTVFNLLTGVYRPTSGSIIWKGENIEGFPPQEIVKRGISRTFQNIRLFGEMRVIENVLIGSHINICYKLLDSMFESKKFKKQEDEATVRAIEVLKSLNMEDKLNDYADSLPYGDQRKVEIARAVATGAELILLDEPAAGMNPQESEELLKFISNIRDLGITILLIEHDMNVVMNVSDRVYVLDNGRLIAEGLPEEVAHNPQVIKAYLGGDAFVER